MGHKILSSKVEEEIEQSKTKILQKKKPSMKGVIDIRVVNTICFVLITVSLILSTCLCFLSIWGAVTSDIIWRAIASFIVVSLTAVIFSTINRKFGPHE